MAIKTPTGSIVVHGLLLAQGCVSWHKNRVLQSAEPKEAVVQRECLESMSHKVTEMRFAVLGTMDKVVGGERAARMRPKMTGPGSCNVGAQLVRRG
jgi:hypothetical protein